MIQCSIERFDLSPPERTCTYSRLARATAQGEPVWKSLNQSSNLQITKSWIVMCLPEVWMAEQLLNCCSLFWVLLKTPPWQHIVKWRSDILTWWPSYYGMMTIILWYEDQSMIILKALPWHQCQDGNIADDDDSDLVMIILMWWTLGLPNTHKDHHWLPSLSLF